MKNIEISGTNRLDQVHHTRTGCRGIVIRDGKILLSAMRMPVRPDEDFFLIPGGGQEEGESLEDCCCREVLEETGFKVQVKEQYLTIAEYYEDVCYIDHYFICEIIEQGRNALTEDEQRYHLVAKWVDLTEAILVFSRHQEYAATDEGWRGAYLREYTALKEYIRFVNSSEDGPEYHEVFHRDGTPTGLIVEKHAKDSPGDYFLHSIIVMKTEDSPAPGCGEGLYIMQQRSLKARYFAGKWDVTGGGVRAYESYEEAAVREAREELGLVIDPADLQEFHQYYADWDDGTGLILKVFACRTKVPEEGFVFNRREVNDVRVVPFSVFKKHVLDHNDEAFGRALDRIEETM